MKKNKKHTFSFGVHRGVKNSAVGTKEMTEAYNELQNDLGRNDYEFDPENRET